MHRIGTLIGSVALVAAFLAAPVLRHRLITNFNAETEGVTTDDIIERLVKLVPKRDE